MNKTLLISKLHRINVTEVELDYEGSCALDTDFIKAGKMQPYQKVDIYNVTNAERFSTYLIAVKQVKLSLLMVPQLTKLPPKILLLFVLMANLMKSKLKHMNLFLYILT